MSELQTLALEHLKKLRQDSADQQDALSRQLTVQAQTIKRQSESINSLTTRQDESEKLLRHLSELYNRLRPLIEAINNDVKNGPR